MPTHELERILQHCEEETLKHLQAYKEYHNADDRQIIAERILIIEGQIGFIKSLLESRYNAEKN